LTISVEHVSDNSKVELSFFLQTEQSSNEEHCVIPLDFCLLVGCRVSLHN
jgi:hypothetical protein